MLNLLIVFNEHFFLIITNFIVVGDFSNYNSRIRFFVIGIWMNKFY